MLANEHSLPHCITVEILGRTPTVLSPAAGGGGPAGAAGGGGDGVGGNECRTAKFRSDVRALDVVPPMAAFRDTCPNLHVCFAEREERVLQTDGAGVETPELAASYSLASQVQEFVFSAADEDTGETVDIEMLWTPEASSLSLIDPALVQYSQYTLHPGGSCDQQVGDVVCECV